MLYIGIGMLIGWNMPQPAFVKDLTNKIKTKLNE